MATEMVDNKIGQWAQKKTVVASGVIAGAGGVALSFIGKGVVPGRVLGDPLPLALSVGQLLRGFLYFNWRAPLFHTLFAAVLGLLTVLFLRLLAGNEVVTVRDVLQAARITAVLNISVVALLEVDAFIVAFWYLMAGWISVFVTSQTAVWIWRQIKLGSNSRD